VADISASLRDALRDRYTIERRLGHGGWLRSISPTMARDHFGLLVSLLLVSCGPSKTVPQARTIADQLERALQEERANTVLSADERGDSVERYVLDEREAFLYTTFATYLVITAKQEGCNKVSTHCVHCPHGRTYCTNAFQFLTPTERGPDTAPVVRSP
jgi:hypothetical protein